VASNFAKVVARHDEIGLGLELGFGLVLGVATIVRQVIEVISYTYSKQHIHSEQKSQLNSSSHHYDTINNKINKKQ